MQNLLLSARIKEMCKKRNMSIQSLLNQCEMNRNTIYDLEKKSVFPSSDKLLKIATTLDCSIDYLFGRDGPENKSNTLKLTKCAIGYIDILGAKKSMQSANADKEISIFMSLLNDAKKNSKKMDLYIKIFSDNILVASPCDEENEIVKAKDVIIFLSWMQFLAYHKYGKLLRGYTHIGDLYIDETLLFGSGIVKSYIYESSYANYPRILIDADIAVPIMQDIYNNIPLVRLDNDGMCFVNYLTCFRQYTVDNVANFYRKIDTEIKKEKTKVSNVNGIIKSNCDIKVLQKLEWTRNYFISFFNESQNQTSINSGNSITTGDINGNNNANINISSEDKSTKELVDMINQLDIVQKSEMILKIREMIKQPQTPGK